VSLVCDTVTCYQGALANGGTPVGVLSQRAEGTVDVFSLDGRQGTGPVEKGGNVAQAYILLQTEVGRAGAVARAVAGIPGVASAEDVTGPYDVIARANASAAVLAELLGRVKAVAGVTRTITCPVANGAL
jgi:hypothetical protein